MKMPSLPTHHYDAGGVGEVFESTKHFWTLRSKFWLWSVITETQHILTELIQKMSREIKGITYPGGSFSKILHNCTV